MSALAIPVSPHVLAEQAALRRSSMVTAIEAMTPSFVRFTVVHSRYRKLRINLTLPDGYPAACLVVDVVSYGVKGDLDIPQGLRKKLEREAKAVAQALLDSGATEVGASDAELTPANSQVLAVLNYLRNFIDTNLFVPCWKELKRTAEHVKSLGTSAQIGMNDATGVVRVELSTDAYRYSATLRLNEGYPGIIVPPSGEVTPNLLPVTVTAGSSTNFPPPIANMITKQAQEIVRRCYQGRDVANALQMSNPIHAPRAFVAKVQGEARITNDTIKDLLHDRETLLKMNKLREVDQAKQAHNAKAALNSTKVRKDARRELSKLAEREMQRDEALAKKLSETEIEIAKRESGWEEDGGEPVHSLYAVVDFLMDSVCKFCERTCPKCGQRILPASPAELISIYDKSKSKTAEEKAAKKEAKARKPTRVFCGCWYHASCLDKLMLEPPFGESCPGSCAGREVYHPDYNDDKSVRERNWMQREARKREVEDVKMMF